jgi:hypothetical protein
MFTGRQLCLSCELNFSGVTGLKLNAIRQRLIYTFEHVTDGAPAAFPHEKTTHPLYWRVLEY